MPVTPGFILTNTGAAAVAASIAGLPVALSHMAFGDAAGAAYTPTGAETALVHEVVRIAVDSVIRDPAHPEQVIVTATVPATQAGFTAREIGVHAPNGDLEVIGPTQFYKAGPADSMAADWTVEVVVAVGATANVTVFLDGAVTATRDWALSAQDFFAVVSATTTAPPGAPVAGDQYLIPAGATGAWSTRGGQIAVWRSVAAGWLYVPAPDGAAAQAADTGALWRRRAGAWSLVFASAAETAAGTRAEAGVTPAGLAASDQTSAHTFAQAGGTANAITASLTPAPAAYVLGMPLGLLVAARNTGAVTVNLNGLGAVGLVGARGEALTAGDLEAGRLIQARFDGAAFQIVSPRTGPPQIDFATLILAGGR